MAYMEQARPPPAQEVAKNSRNRTENGEEAAIPRQTPTVFSGYVDSS
jgi:hypothetical protein